MKYNDKSTRISCYKEFGKESESISDRNIRRENDRAVKKFSQRVYSFVDRDWWDCVTIHQKRSLYSVWINRNKIYPIEFGKWINEIKKNVIIDKALFREKKINKLIKK